jgi:hypothetical protein
MYCAFSMFLYEVTNEKSMPVFLPPILWCSWSCNDSYEDLHKLDYIENLKKIHASLFFTILKKKLTFCKKNWHPPKKKKVHATLDHIESNM